MFVTIHQRSPQRYGISRNAQVHPWSSGKPSLASKVLETPYLWGFTKVLLNRYKCFIWGMGGHFRRALKTKIDYYHTCINSLTLTGTIASNLPGEKCL